MENDVTHCFKEPIQGAGEDFRTLFALIGQLPGQGGESGGVNTDNNALVPAGNMQRAEI
ncbi:MAG: hypothetical protein KAT58_02975 [candidate division Zixibacteria bacterium]|nr:hypothetical protein [candidate division Zixibacteria bacterium]